MSPSFIHLALRKCSRVVRVWHRQKTDRIASLMDLGRQFAVIVKNEDEKNDMIDE
jgi:hypothetical protein